MATSSEANAVYAAGLVQGIVLVTFPAASTVFTDPAQYDLSSTQDGTMFLPQVVTAIIASLLGGGLARRLGSKHRRTKKERHLVVGQAGQPDLTCGQRPPRLARRRSAAGLQPSATSRVPLRRIHPDGVMHPVPR